MNDDLDNRITFSDRFDYYDEPVADHWEVIWYVVKSILSGIGFITFAFLLGYWSTR